MPASSDADLAHDLRLAASVAHQSLTRAVASQGVTAAEWLLLRDLHAAGAVPQTRLAERLGLTRGAVSKLVDRLVAKRLLVRGRGGGGDRRIQIIGLTGTGALLVPELAKTGAESDAALFARLSSRERAVLESALAKLAGRPPAR
ncbi:MarR family transcriptional regulator [Sphingomonas aliaeris]|uniref:MarR family transcriptional regulator n=1 Tax=Sphingomonas aliaeris TaxID=2759526 RepID=A0A974S564_9SPHN|nr:MarR family transcriptional regulator [Sphingomonas aliaeris]QQV78373.1 MarR family transcriptional regulator [Sphingomonas aliaeris]